jgi:hypothetical protein
MPCLMPGRKTIPLSEVHHGGGQDAGGAADRIVAESLEGKRRRLSTMGSGMAVTFMTCPFEGGVTTGNGGGIVVEDRKTGEFWRLPNRQNLFG